MDKVENMLCEYERADKDTKKKIFAAFAEKMAAYTGNNEDKKEEKGVRNNE